MTPYPLSPSSFFCGFDWYKANGSFLIADPEKALVDCLYLSSYKNKRFGHFPELHFPATFSVKKVRAWIMHTLIKNGKVILDGRIASGASVEIKGSKIAAVGVGPQSKEKLLRPFGPRNDKVIVIDAKNCFVSPGLIDCHIHGEPDKIFSNEAKHGTTSFVIAESCAPLKDIYTRIERIRKFKKTNPLGKNILGVRLEGPYISKTKAGAQNPAYIKSPDAKELNSIIKHCSGLLKIMTIAPELKWVRPLLGILAKNGVIASIGHSDATYKEAIKGIDAGMSHATHVFNAMSGKNDCGPGVVGAILSDDRITAEIILDLVHVSKANFKLLLKSKRKSNIIIVTDSVIHSRRGRLNVPYGLKRGAYRFSDGKLAGSALTMIGALKNAVTKCGVALEGAINMITLNPARLLGIDSKKGSIAPGKDADIVVFDKDFNVKTTIIRGKIAYESRKTNECGAKWSLPEGDERRDRL